MNKDKESSPQKGKNILGKTISTITAYGLLKNAALTTYQDITALKTSVSAYISDFKKKETTTYETFEDAACAHNTNEMDVKKRYRHLQWQFWIYMLFLASIPFIINESFNAGFGIIMIGAIGMGLMALAKAMQTSYFCWQLKNRQFIDLKTWLSHPSYWIPGKYGSSR